MSQAIKTDAIRPLRVRALADFECVTHVCCKGKEYIIQSDHAQDLVDKGLIEVAAEPQRAVRKVETSEKRG